MDSINYDAIRQFCRSELKFRLDQLRAGGDAEKMMEQKQELIESLRVGPIASMSSEVNQELYDLPTDFYQLFLGKRLKWSTGFFTTGEETIDEAEEAMLDLSCRRCQLEDGMKVLDLGCGWGSLAFWIIEKYKSCHVTCVSNSKTQMRYIDALAKEKGVGDRINCITADINDFDTTEKFDRVTTIEMLEHMINFELLMKNIAKWLKDDGMLFVQSLGHREFAYFYCIPSDKESTRLTSVLNLLSLSPDLLLYFQKDLFIVKQWILNGRHMVASARGWRRKFEENQDLALQMFAAAHGTNNAQDYFREWIALSLFVEENYSFNGCNEWGACHQLFKKR